MSAKYDCPKCGAVLRPAQAVAPGKKIRCPKCQTAFPVPAEDEAPPKKAIAKAPVKSAKLAKPAPPPEPEKKPNDEPEIGTYQLAEPTDTAADDFEVAEEDRKPQIEYAPDLSVKDPRGPASAALATPSSLITLLGAVMVVAGLGGAIFFTWVFMFTENGTSVQPIEARIKAGVVQLQVLKKDQESLEPELAYKDLNEKEKAVFNEMKDEDVQWRIIMALLCIVGLIYGGVMAAASVKMTVLESYKWSMTAAIMACITIIGAPMGIIALTMLKKDETKYAFEYDPD